MIAWFARNPVAANLLMAGILFMGLFSLKNLIPLEVFPSFELDVIEISTTLRGATPAAVEDGVTTRIEEAIYDLPGIKKISSRSAESLSVISVEVENNKDARELLSDIKLRVDAISTLPNNTERPVIRLPLIRREVISVVLSGDLTEKELRLLGEKVREDLLRLEQISQIQYDGVRDLEIAIEVSPKILNAHNLTLAQVANAIQAGSVDLSAGNIKTRGGEVLVRTNGQAYTKSDFEEIVVIARPDGVAIRVKDIAEVTDGFEDTSVISLFNGQPAIILDVFRVGDQDAIEVADLVKDYIATAAETLPQGVNISYWRDRSQIVKARLKTLTNSALQGGCLVLLLLALFLRPAVAFWVCLGIPVSFMGAFLFMPIAGVTLNVVSLFGFILVLGIVVDDAIVTGENIYRHMQRGRDPLEASIRGAQEVSVPVTFGILTTVVAFIPILSIQGARGAIFSQIPLIVIPVLLFSLIESKLILPAHLRHLKPRKDEGCLAKLMQLQKKISSGFEEAILRFYKPVLQWCLNYKGRTLLYAFSVTIIIFSLVFSGWMRFVFFPRVESETVRVSLTMPATTGFAVTNQYIEHMVKQAQMLQQKYLDPETGQSLITDVYSTSGSSAGLTQPNVGRVTFAVMPPEKRFMDIRVAELVKEWREAIGPIPGAERLSFRAEIGRGGEPIDVQLTGQDLDAMAEMAEKIKLKLREYPGVFDIQDSLSDGKEELQLFLKPQAESLGVSLAEVAQQVRQAFFGFEAQRIQRGRDEVRVMVRYPQEQRSSINSLYDMLIQTADGSQIPLTEVVEVHPGSSPSALYRIDRFRTLNITADVNKQSTDVEAVKRELIEYLDGMINNYPGISYDLEGEAREQRETFGSLRWGSVFVMLAIYILLAIPFKSYWQPFIVMSIIPLGLVGAVIGHLIMGMNLTVMSVLGMLALTGVVVNDSLVLVDYINKQIAKGDDLMSAVVNSGVARFRPVILTSLTTFAGLTPLLFEKSTQAKFLIPMAVSLGFGIIFATVITLLIVPVNYTLMSGLRNWIKKHMGSGDAVPVAYSADSEAR